MIPSLDDEELTNPIFSAADVVRSTGVSTSILQQWCNRGIVRFSQVQLGERTFRRFSILDALTIAVMQSVRKLGVNPLEAKELAANARAGIGQRLLFSQDHIRPRMRKPVQTGRYLVVFNNDGRGNGPAMFFGEDSLVGNISNYCEAALVIDLDAVVVRVTAELREEDATR